MKKLIVSTILILCLLVMCGCGESAPEDVSESLFTGLLRDYIREEGCVMSAAVGLLDLDGEIEFFEYSCENGHISVEVNDYILCPPLDELIEKRLVSKQFINEIEKHFFDVNAFEYGGYTLEINSVNEKIRFRCENGEEYLFGEGCVYDINGNLLFEGYDEENMTAGTSSSSAAETEDEYDYMMEAEWGGSLEEKVESETEVTEETDLALEVPHLGMNASLISKTALGEPDKTGYNTQKYASDYGARDHDCTLYYWMNGSQCIFLARVQEDIGRVITVDDYPSGSYFGN